jgi:hypothetical protein
MRVLQWLGGVWLIGWAVTAAPTVPTVPAANVKIIKVLPSYLDLAGRQSLSPSLYERDAYQAILRRNPVLRTGMRFDVQWKASGIDPHRLKIRLEVRGSKTNTVTPLVLERPVKPRGLLGHWLALSLDAPVCAKLGDVTSWRVTVWDEDRQLAERRSFLWQSDPSREQSGATSDQTVPSSVGNP